MFLILMSFSVFDFDELCVFYFDEFLCFECSTW